MERGSDAILDVDAEDNVWGHAPLTASPWGTQDRGERGLPVDVRAGGSDGWKVPSAQVRSDRDRRERRRAGKGDSDAKIEGWSVGSEGDSAKETEEDGISKGDQGKSETR